MSRPEPPPRLIPGFRTLAMLRPYASRLRLTRRDFDSGPDPASVMKMRQILTAKGISSPRADGVINETLDAAADHCLENVRWEQFRESRKHSLQSATELISSLSKLEAAIGRFPPRARGQLNKQAQSILSRQRFDTETLIELLEGVERALCQLSPRCHAIAATEIFFSKLPRDFGGDQVRTSARTHIVNLWEMMPAEMRIEVERRVGTLGRVRSLSKWLQDVIRIIEEEVRAMKPRRPLSSQRRFIARALKIWSRLSLPGGLYFSVQDERGAVSAFRRFCRLAVAAFGNHSDISARQISTAKRKRL